MHKAAEEAMALRASVWGQNTGIAQLARSLASLSLFSLLAVPADSRFPPKDRPSPERDRVAAQIRLPFKAWLGTHSG
jgi:hypothetical protein